MDVHRKKELNYLFKKYGYEKLMAVLGRNYQQKGVPNALQMLRTREELNYFEEKYTKK